MPLAASLATFAVATQFGARWAGWPLAAGFAVAIIGHCFGAWDLQSKASSWKARLTMAGFNALGLLVLLIGEGPCALWRTPMAVLSVVVLFLFFQREYRLACGVLATRVVQSHSFNKCHNISNDS